MTRIVSVELLTASEDYGTVTYTVEVRAGARLMEVSEDFRALAGIGIDEDVVQFKSAFTPAIATALANLVAFRIGADVYAITSRQRPDARDVVFFGRRLKGTHRVTAPESFRLLETGDKRLLEDGSFRELEAA